MHTLSASSRSRNILVVDDEPSVRETATRILRHGGHQVSASASAEEALEILNTGARNVELIVSDVCMPGMSGLELAKCVSEKASEISVILMSGYNSRLSMLGMIRDGNLNGSRYLEKPFGAAQLLAVVQSSSSWGG